MEPKDETDQCPKTHPVTYRDFVRAGLVTFFLGFVWLTSALACFLIALNMPSPQGSIPTIIGLAALCVGFPYFITGCGFLKARSWARASGLALGALSFSIAVLGPCLLAFVLFLASFAHNPLLRNEIVFLASYLLLVALNLGYGIYILRVFWRRDVNYR
jgi:hypothetical protein